MKKTIITLNLAGHAWNRSTARWTHRLNDLCNLIKSEAPNAFIIALQEFKGGTNYLQLIQKNFPNYIIITPEGYDPDDNKRSAVNLLLINKGDCRNYSIRSLEIGRKCFLYNYVFIETYDGHFFRILNLHLPHANNEYKPLWYQKDRNLLRSSLESAVIDTSSFFRTEQDIHFILLGDLNAEPDTAFIKKIATYKDSALWNGTRSTDLNKGTFLSTEIGSHIDYIFYSRPMLFNPGIDPFYNEISSEPITKTLSDHALIIGSFECA